MEREELEEKQMESEMSDQPLKKHLCSECGKSFSRAGHLERHFRVHTGEKPFACDVCDKTFSREFHLRRHQVSHTKEKQFVCEICSKAFGVAHHLKRHIRNLHAVEEVVRSDQDLYGDRRSTQEGESRSIQEREGMVVEGEGGGRTSEASSEGLGSTEVAVSPESQRTLQQQISSSSSSSSSEESESLSLAKEIRLETRVRSSWSSMMYICRRSATWFTITMSAR
eukprot:GILI01043010.1.p1 GENE.GILI01043010.1~~GILI01043010.1.p1  ORF type:complete len:244 (+),score=26.85 GILI01043010.1:58-732(+)